MSNYQEVLQQAQSLTPEEQIRLIEDLSSFIRQRVTMTSKPKRSILELRGLGKEIWQGIDAQEYVNQERDSFLESETTQQPKQMMQFGMFSGNQQSTEADFPIAEFHGDNDNSQVSN